MSVLVVVQVTGDTETFRRALSDRAQEFEEIGQRARAAGAIHHRFGIGEGVVVVVDEWGDAGQFEAFFGDPAMQEFVMSIGADPAPPQITIAEAVSSPDQF